MLPKLRMVAAVCLLALCVQSLGCSSPYWTNRGKDFMEIIELGVTVSPHWKPDFALHANFFNVTPLGVSYIDGKYIGWGYRQFGVMDYRDRTWGLLLWGREDLQLGEFDPLDPHQAPAGEIRQLSAAGRPLPDRMAIHDVGVVGMIQAGKTPPWPTFMACRKNIHLGWIGAFNICRPVDLVDFILGWGGIDFVGDDLAQ